MGAVIKKELKNYFLSPIGYVVIGIFLIVFSLLFPYPVHPIILQYSLENIHCCKVESILKIILMKNSLEMASKNHPGHPSVPEQNQLQLDLLDISKLFNSTS